MLGQTAVEKIEHYLKFYKIYSEFINKIHNNLVAATGESLSSVQLHILLSFRGANKNYTDLYRNTYLANKNLAYAVKQLVEKNIVKIKNFVGDDRKRTIDLTEKGKFMLEQINKSLTD